MSDLQSQDYIRISASTLTPPSARNHEQEVAKLIDVSRCIGCKACQSACIEWNDTHPAIEDVQVIGVPDEKYGEELCAWVKLRPGAELTGEEVRAYCSGKIAHYKIPRYVRFTEGFPMTVTGKVQKFRMRETSIAELGLEAASQTRTA